jgi:hypothetical protein
MTRETLFEFMQGTRRWRCELVDLGERGVEAQLYRNDEFIYSYRFDRSGYDHTLARDLAIAWANMKRRSIELG